MNRVFEFMVLFTQLLHSTKMREQDGEKNVISLIYIALLASFIIHYLAIWTFGDIVRDISQSQNPSAITTIEFAMEDAEILSQMPEGDELEYQEAFEPFASTDMPVATQSILSADVTTAPLERSSHTIAPSLGGSAGRGMDRNMGGSGGFASFFGIVSSGSRFCYIVDISSSMRSQHRFEQAIAELSKSIKRLPDFAQFYILFYNDHVVEPTMQKGWNTARASIIRRMLKEFKYIHASNGTVPAPAFRKAFTLKPLPDIIFFLADGQLFGFNSTKLKAMLPTNKRIIVNTIAFGESADQKVMKSIAKETGGQYTFVKSGMTP